MSGKVRSDVRSPELSRPHSRTGEHYVGKVRAARWIAADSCT